MSLFRDESNTYNSCSVFYVLGVEYPVIGSILPKDGVYVTSGVGTDHNIVLKLKARGLSIYSNGKKFFRTRTGSILAPSEKTTEEVWKNQGSKQN